MSSSDIEQALHLVQALGMKIRRGDSVGLHEVVPQQAANHRLAHRTGADEGDGRIVQNRGPCQELLLSR